VITYLKIFLKKDVSYMQLTTAQQYLVKTNKNLVYHFFIDHDKSLHYSIYTDNNTIIKSDQLADSIIEFSVTIDNHEKIHLICVTNEAELLYYIHQNDKWNCKTISKLDFKSNTYRYLTLYVQGSYTHIIYNKTNLLTPMLSSIEHIYWNQSGINKSIVGNYIHGRYPSPLQVSIDSSNNLHLVYKVYYKNNHQLYYSKFNILTKKWSTGELITNLQEDHSHPYIFADTDNCIHLVWCTIEQNNIILKYKKKTNAIKGKSKWSSTQSLSNKNSNTLSPTLIQESDMLKIYCKQNNQIIEIVSTDFGNSWKSSDNIYIIEDPKIIRYSNSLKKAENLFINHIYGNIIDKIEVVGFDLFNNTEDQAITTDPKEELIIKPVLDTNINTPIENMEENINKTYSPVKEHLLKDKLENVPSTQDFYTANENNQSTKIINELFSDYESLKNKLIEIEEEKEKFSKTITDCEVYLNLLEEKIVDYKKLMLTLQEKLNLVTTNGSIFQRLINFFK